MRCNAYFNGLRCNFNNCVFCPEHLAQLSIEGCKSSTYEKVDQIIIIKLEGSTCWTQKEDIFCAIST